VDGFEPKIVAFCCSWCAYAGADLAGTSRIQYPHNLRMVRVMCSGSIDPLFILYALVKGADGVFIGGCHPGECHYLTGNYRARRRIAITKKLLEYMGIDSRRIQASWVSASEGVKFAEVITKMAKELKEIGPMNCLPKEVISSRLWDRTREAQMKPQHRALG
jgi:F420-non-reducing hydrogenase iron-sulfur subunit